MQDRPLTLLLRRMAGGDEAAGDELFSLLEDDLRSRAGRLMKVRADHTLQPTAVVNEAWLRLAGQAADAVDWVDRDHFFGVAARAMRSVLVDHARKRRAAKRGGDLERVPLDEALASYESAAVDLLDLDAALARLAEVDPELARLVELRFFGGLSIPETARVMQTSTATVERGWTTARALLRVQLAGSTRDDP